MNNSSVAGIRTVLFDLDGTFADTAPDLADALNLTLQHEAQSPLPFEVIRPHVSHGSLALIKLGFRMDESHPDFSRIRKLFLDQYLAILCRRTMLFDGMTDLLVELQKLGINWGIVTNKPAYLTDPLMAKLKLPSRPACVISGDTTNNRKPHPEPMLLACSLAGSQPHECLYIGDAERDIIAGRDAGMHTLIAAYGYIDVDEKPESWNADGIVNDVPSIIDWIRLVTGAQAEAESEGHE